MKLGFNIVILPRVVLFGFGFEKCYSMKGEVERRCDSFFISVGPAQFFFNNLDSIEELREGRWISAKKNS